MEVEKFSLQRFCDSCIEELLSEMWLVTYFGINGYHGRRLSKLHNFLKYKLISIGDVDRFVLVSPHRGPIAIVKDQSRSNPVALKKWNYSQGFQAATPIDYQIRRHNRP